MLMLGKSISKIVILVNVKNVLTKKILIPSNVIFNMLEEFFLNTLESFNQKWR